MTLDSFDMVASLQALPETDPIEIEGIQFTGGGARTCGSACVLLTVNILQTVCAIFASCK
ncbi:MAG: VenA family class IV lanthipeptide [Pseudonocardia sp.]